MWGPENEKGYNFIKSLEIPKTQYIIRNIKDLNQKNHPYGLVFFEPFYVTSSFEIE